MVATFEERIASNLRRGAASRDVAVQNVVSQLQGSDLEYLLPQQYHASVPMGFTALPDNALLHVAGTDPFGGGMSPGNAIGAVGDYLEWAAGVGTTEEGYDTNLFLPTGLLAGAAKGALSGLSKKAAQSWLKGYIGTGLSGYAKKALIGAGVGAAVYGASQLFGDEENQNIQIPGLPSALPMAVQAFSGSGPGFDVGDLWPGGAVQGGQVLSPTQLIRNVRTSGIRRMRYRLGADGQWHAIRRLNPMNPRAAARAWRRLKAGKKWAFRLLRMTNSLPRRHSYYRPHIGWHRRH